MTRRYIEMTHWGAEYKWIKYITELTPQSGTEMSQIYTEMARSEIEMTKTIAEMTQNGTEMTQRGAEMTQNITEMTLRWHWNDSMKIYWNDSEWHRND